VFAVFPILDVLALDILVYMSALCILDIGIDYNLDDVGILLKSSLFLGFVVILPPNNFDLIQNPANFVFHQPRMLDLLVCMPALVDMSALGILDLGIDYILGPDILVEMPTFDIPADFPSLDMPVLDILVYLPILDILGPEVEDILTGLPLADILDLSACILVCMPVLDLLDYHLLCTLPLCVCPLDILGFEVDDVLTGLPTVLSTGFLSGGPHNFLTILDMFDLFF
jgi:hypothetical protein